jgi:outer membrane protein assembly factor BamB
VAAGHDSDAAGSAEAFSAAAGSSGMVGSITVYVDSASQASKVTMGLYSDNGGRPGTLLTQGTITAPTSAAWNTATVPSVSVTAGTTYWITILSPAGSGQVYFRDAASGTLSQSSSQTNLTALTATWSPGASWNNSPISAYANSATSGPVLGVAPSALSVGAISGGPNPPAATLNVSNPGSGSLSYSASTDASWLNVAPASGNAPQAVSVTAAANGLSPGTYTGHVTITAAGAQGSPQVVPVTLTVNSSASAADWPTIEHDAARSGTATAETQITSSNASSLTQAWTANLDGKVTAQPLFLGGMQVEGATHDVVVATTNQNTVYALDAGTGTVLWSRHLLPPPSSCGLPGGFGISGTPVVDRSTDRIYAVTDDGVLHTLSLADGSDAAPSLPVVANPATDYVWGGMTIANGNLYIPTGSDGCDTAPWQGGIYQVSVSGWSPALVKHWITVPSLPASTAGGGIWGYGGVSVDPTSGHVYAASADDGTGLSGDEGYTPYSGSMLALDGNLNLLGWFQPAQAANYNCGGSPPCDQDFASTPLIFQPPGCPKMLATGNKNGQLYVISASNLEADNGFDASHVQAIQLNNDIDDLGQGGLSGTPTYSSATNMVYVVDTGQGVTGIAAGLVGLSVQSDCSLKVAWSHPVGGAISNSPNSIPTLANGVLFVGVNDGSVSAFDPANGTRLWNSGSNGFAVYAAPVVAHGMVFAAVWNGATASASGSVRAWSVPTSPVLGLSPKSLSFSATAGGSNPNSQSVAVSNQGVGTLSFTATSNAPWLSVSPTSGTAPATLTVQPSISGLSPGSYTGTITVTPNSGAAQMVNVTLTVNPQNLTTLLGDGNVENTADDDSAGQAEAFSTTASASGSLTQLRVYVAQGTAPGNLIAGLYSASAGRPAQLLTQGTLNHPAAGTWNTIIVPATAVTSGTSYWIAILSPAGSGTLNFRDRAGGGTSYTSSSANLTTLPGSWANGAAWSNSNLSATGLG